MILPAMCSRCMRAHWSHDDCEVPVVAVRRRQPLPGRDMLQRLVPEYRRLAEGPIEFGPIFARQWATEVWISDRSGYLISDAVGADR